MGIRRLLEQCERAVLSHLLDVSAESAGLLLFE
jgi:hypothetical protein